MRCGKVAPKGNASAANESTPHTLVQATTATCASGAPGPRVLSLRHYFEADHTNLVVGLARGQVDENELGVFLSPDAHRVFVADAGLVVGPQGHSVHH